MQLWNYRLYDLIEFAVTVSLIAYVVRESVFLGEITSTSLYFGTAVYTVLTSISTNSAFHGGIRGLLFALALVILHSLCVKVIGLILVTAGVDVDRNIRYHFEEGIVITLVMWPIFQTLRLFPAILFAISSAWLAANLILLGRRHVIAVCCRSETLRNDERLKD